MSNHSAFSGKYCDWNEPLEAMLRATESTLQRLKANHEKYKKSKNKLEAALNAPTKYIFKQDATENENKKDSNEINVASAVKEKTKLQNTFTGIDSKSGKFSYHNYLDNYNNNNNREKGTSLSRATSHSISRAWYPAHLYQRQTSHSQQRASSLQSSKDYNTTVNNINNNNNNNNNNNIIDNNNELLTANFSIQPAMYAPTPASMSMIRIFQSQLKNLMHELWTERSQREDSVRSCREKYDMELEEVQVQVQHISREVERIREEEALHRQHEQEIKEYEHQYHWGSDHHKEKINMIEAQLEQLTQQVQLLTEKSNNTSLLVKQIKEGNEIALTSLITNAVNTKIKEEQQKLLLLSSSFSSSSLSSSSSSSPWNETLWNGKLQEKVKELVQCYCEKIFASRNDEKVKKLVTDSLLEGNILNRAEVKAEILAAKEELRKEQESMINCKFDKMCHEWEQLFRDEWTQEMNKMKKKQKDELCNLQLQVNKQSETIANVKQEITAQLAYNKIPYTELLEQTHKLTNTNALNKETCSIVVQEMMEPLYMQLTELQRKCQELQLPQNKQDTYCTEEQMHQVVQCLENKIDEVKLLHHDNNNSNNNNNKVYDKNVFSEEDIDHVVEAVVHRRSTDHIDLLLQKLSSRQEQVQKENDEKKKEENSNMYAETKNNAIPEFEQGSMKQHNFEAFMARFVEELQKQSQQEEFEQPLTSKSLSKTFLQVISHFIIHSSDFSAALQQYGETSIMENVNTIIKTQLQQMEQQTNVSHAQHEDKLNEAITTLQNETNKVVNQSSQEQLAELKQEIEIHHEEINQTMQEYCNEVIKCCTDDLMKKIQTIQEVNEVYQNSTLNKLETLEQNVTEDMKELESSREENECTLDTHNKCISALEQKYDDIHDKLELMQKENAVVLAHSRMSDQVEREVINYVDAQVEMLDTTHEVEVSELIKTLSTVHDSIAQCVSHAGQTLERKNWNNLSNALINVNDKNENKADLIDKPEHDKEANKTKFANLEEVITFIMEQVVFLRQAAEILQYNSSEMLSIIASHEEEIITGIPLQQHILSELIKYVMRLQGFTEQQEQQKEQLTNSRKSDRQSESSPRVSSLYDTELREPSIEPLQQSRPNDEMLQNLLKMLTELQSYESEEELEKCCTEQIWEGKKQIEE